MRTIYLAGLISTEFPESLEWRERITPVLWRIGFSVRDPMAGKKNLKQDSKDGGLTSVLLTSKDIILRDRRDVRESDVILANLETYGCPRPSLGTIAELAWAWDQRTLVVGIAREDNYVIRKHPFTSEFVSHFVKDEEEAVEFLSSYYGE